MKKWQLTNTGQPVGSQDPTQVSQSLVQQRRSITTAGGATISISAAEVGSTAVVIGLAEAKVRKVNMLTMDSRSMLTLSQGEEVYLKLEICENMTSNQIDFNGRGCLQRGE